MNADVYIEFSNSPKSQGTLVFVDGNQVNGVQRLEVIAEANDVVRVRMEIIPGDLTIRSSAGQTFKAVTEFRDAPLLSELADAEKPIGIYLPFGEDGKVTVTDKMAERALQAYDDYLEGPTRSDHSSLNLMRHTLQQAFGGQE